MSKILYCHDVGKKEFEGETFKKAYMSAIKWVASNILADDNLNDIVVQYSKANDGIPKIIVRLYVYIDEKELRKRQCKTCKEMHNSFFINNSADCSRCEAAAYQRRADKYISSKKSYYREILMKKDEE